MKFLSQFKLNFQHALGILLVVLIFLYFFFGKNDPAIVSTCKDILIITSGYFFGSSIGSRNKEKTLSEVIKNNP